MMTTRKRQHPFLPRDYVYVAEFGAGLVKVGRSTNPEGRTQALATGSGRKLGRVWISNPVCFAGPFEKRAHAELDEHRSHGEWFNCCFENAVERVAKQFSEDELWTEEKSEERALRAEKVLGILQAAVMGTDDGSAFAQYRNDFLRNMRERVIKNYITYLHFQNLAEQAFIEAVSQELTECNEWAGSEVKEDIATVLALSNDAYREAEMNAHINLGITLESCMLYTQDVNRIPEVLEEVAVIANQRLASQESD